MSLDYKCANSPSLQRAHSEHMQSPRDRPQQDNDSNSQQAWSRKRRARSLDLHVGDGLSTRPRKQRRRSLDAARIPSDHEDSESGDSKSDVGIDSKNPIAYWAQFAKWPEGYPAVAPGAMHYARRRTPLSRKRSDAGYSTPTFETPSDQKPRELKTAPYANARYEFLLNSLDVFLTEHARGITDRSEQQCADLLNSDSAVPENTLFRDDLFKAAIQKLQSRNEAKVIQDITRLIVPSAEALTTYGASQLQCLIESVNEGWNNCMPITTPRPQPDYAVGFRRDAFTQAQLDKLKPYIGDILNDISEIMGTHYMYYPFLTCEVKGTDAGLDVADRQNAHSMTVAVRAVVELFKSAKREQEIDRQVLAFSVSHNHNQVRIYGHYPVLDGSKITYYRHAIRNFSLADLGGKEKWTAYKFTKNVYEKWMPSHLSRIHSAIDSMPDEPREPSRESELYLTDDQGGYGVSHSSASSAMQVQHDNAVAQPQEAATVGTTSAEKVFKKPKRERGGGSGRGNRA